MNTLNELLKCLKWSQSDLSRDIDVSVNTVSTWATGKHKTPVVVLKYLKQKVDIKKAVGE